MFFDKANQVFRAGKADANYWDAASRGFGSVAFGENSAVSGTYGCAIGIGHTVSGTNARAGGAACTATGTSAVAEGSGSTASGNYSRATGNSALAGRHGQESHSSGSHSSAGDAQSTRFIFRQATTNATPTLVTANASTTAILTASTANVFTIPASRAARFRVDVIARNMTADECAGWEFKGVITRHTSGDARFVGTVDQTAWGDAAAAAWDVTLSINNGNATNNYLAITVTGEAAKTIRWVATLQATEVG
jgi:hypothetical protein